MNFNKCVRCGAFFINNSNVCPNCETKDKNDISNLQNFLIENNMPNSIDELSISTGIATKNLNRFLSEKRIEQIEKL